VFKKGDLVKFNKHGEDLFNYLGASVGLISSEPTVMYEHDFDEKIQYIVYDLIVDGQLFKHIPEEFLDRITRTDEEDTEELE
tara:strand:+ start:211 stop:456 length:246 start_codon:yes stop_codon:yes gene_type:complete